jgi:hypothetical protein
MKYLFLPIAVLFIALMIVGCQNSVSPTTSPVQPAESVQNENQQSNNQLRNVWGFYNCVADLQAGIVTVVPDRGAEMHVNVTKPLNKSLGLGVSIKPGSTPASGYLVIDVSIKHPYPGVTSYTGFDVHGILLTTGSVNAGGFKIAGPSDPMLLNPDGWSRWWNPTEFSTPGLMGYVPGAFSKQPPGGPPSATVNPYKLFADGLSATDSLDFFKTKSINDTNSRAVFSSSSTNTRQYKIQFPVDGGLKIYFDYAVDASWFLPLVNPPVTLPDDFPINANSLEAFIVAPTITECTLAGNTDGLVGTGNLKLSIDLWDWQGWAEGSYANQIGTIKLYSPSVVFDPLQIQQVDGAKNTTITITATGVPSAIGTIPVVIEIPSPGTAWKQGVQAAPVGLVSAYTVINIEVTELKCAPDNNITCDDAVNVNLKSTVSSTICMPSDPSDFYVFVVPSGQIMEGTITLDNFDYADNDLLLYDGCPGNAVQMALNSGTGKEIMDLANLESGFYYIDVLPGSDADTDVQPYKLTLDIHVPSTACTTDDDNTYDKAQPLALEGSISGTVCSGGDVHDWLKITVPAGKVAGGSLYLDNKSSGDINIRVYDTYPGSPTYWSTNTGNQDEMVTILGLGPGDHYIDIYTQGSNPSGDRAYQLDSDLPASNFSCSSGDGNDSTMTADPIPLISVVDGTVCFPTDPDWYTFIVPENKSASGTITLSGNNTVDNDLYLFGDPTADPIDSSAVAGLSDEVITLNQLGAGTYYLEAAARPVVGGGDQQYSLTMDVTLKASGNYDFKVHAFIISKTDGSAPATTEAKVQADVNWANTFYSTWGGSWTLAKIDYVKNTAWLAASSSEMWTCDSIYGDSSGPINVYYVNSFTDIDGAAAYTVMDCRYAYETHTSTYVVMSDDGSYPALAHEMGHATAILIDMYLLDYYTCSELFQNYCPASPNNAYCNTADKHNGNLMYWPYYTSPSDYMLSDKNWQSPAKPIESQIENWTYFHTNYPNNF